jgi:hypothetical protein
MGLERALGLDPGEVVRWQGPADQTVRQTWVAGRIYVTDRRFIFRPGRRSRRRFETVRLPLSAIVGIDVLEETGTPDDGGMRRRMRVSLASGAAELFALPHVDARAAQLWDLVATGSAVEEPTAGPAETTGSGVDDPAAAAAGTASAVSLLLDQFGHKPS